MKRTLDYHSTNPDWINERASYTFHDYGNSDHVEMKVDGKSLRLKRMPR
ncbi:MAG: hypothetical protein R3E01_28150 [Pirellulaceae bacterium]